MAFFECHFFSESLAMSVSANVVLPQPVPPDCPTLWLLHGLSDDHTMWMRRTGIERHATTRNLAVVMPAVARSFYQDMASGPRYWAYLHNELPAAMRSFFPLSAARSRNFAAGLSMGGYGAMRLALACPERIAAAASMSGALDFAGRLKSAGQTGSRISLAEWQAIAGQDLSPNPDSDLFSLARAVPADMRPALWVDCGTEDELLGNSRDFHALLDSIGWAHHYEEPPGAHDWAYWDAQIQRIIAWLPL